MKQFSTDNADHMHVLMLTIQGGLVTSPHGVSLLNFRSPCRTLKGTAGSTSSFHAGG